LIEYNKKITNEFVTVLAEINGSSKNTSYISENSEKSEDNLDTDFTDITDINELNVNPNYQKPKKSSIVKVNGNVHNNGAVFSKLKTESIRKEDDLPDNSWIGKVES